MTALTDGDYIWELPIYIDGSTIMLNISKGKPLDESITAFAEAEKAEVTKNVGKWLITAVYYYEGEIRDYYAIVKNELGYFPEDVVFVGRLPQFRSAVAFFSDGNAEIKELIALGGSRPNIPSANNTNNETGVAVEQGSGSRLYDYAETKGYVNSLPEETSNDLVGAGGVIKDNNSMTGVTETNERVNPVSYITQYWPISVLAILGITGGTDFLVKKKKG